MDPDEARHSYTQTRIRSIPEMENSKGRKHDFTFCESANAQLRDRSTRTSCQAPVWDSPEK